MHKVILSRNRSRTINTHTLLHSFDLVVPASQVAEYECYAKGDVIAIPDEVHGLGAVRNWILDYYGSDPVVMLDDDLRTMVSVGGLATKRYKNPDVVEHILADTYQCSIDAECNLWGYNQSPHPAKYRLNEPFRLNTWVGTIVGVNDRQHKWSEVNKVKVDIDVSLKYMLTDRIVWIDQRWGFDCTRDVNAGGNSLYRTQERVEKEMRFIKEKWGDHVRLSKHAAKYAVHTRVKRRQNLPGM